jgi:hypothetical protein
MANRLLALFAGLMLVLAVGACQKSGEEPITKGMQGSQLPQQAPHELPIPVKKGETKIVVPDSVKGKWSAVKIAVQDKTAGTEKDVTIKLGDEYSIPGSDLKLQVGDFLPDFRMQEGLITSNSDEPNNPAVHVTVLEGGKEIFNGWLYSKFPAIHPFEHGKYGLLLKEGIKKG